VVSPGGTTASFNPALQAATALGARLARTASRNVLIPLGGSYWVRLVQRFLPLS
jgi:hypothetical protein